MPKPRFKFKAQRQYLWHEAVYSPGTDIKIGENFDGLILGLKYHLVDIQDHSLHPLSEPLEFNVDFEIFGDDLLIFFSFTTQGADEVQSTFVNLARKI